MILKGLIFSSEADPNIRDYSGKKPKQYLKNSASSRAQRKFLSSSITDSCDSSMTATLRSNVSVGPPTTESRPSVSLRSGLTISEPMDFRSSVNLSPNPSQNFGSAAQRSSIRILHLSLSDQAPEGNSSVFDA